MRLKLLSLVAVVLVASMGAVTTVPAFDFTCSTTAQRIAPPTGPSDYSSITVWNAACSGGTCTTSSTPVFLGGLYSTTAPTRGSLVTAVTTSTGMPICNTASACAAPLVTYDVSNLQCIVASGTVHVTVQVGR